MPYFVTEDQTPIYFLDEGPRSPEAIVLVHGEPCNSLFWQKNIGELSQSHRVVAMDIRGRGQSGKAEHGHTLGHYARDVRGLMESLGLTRVVLVGWSLGSAVGWRYIEQFGSDRLCGFVNVDQSPYRYVSEENLAERLSKAQENRLQNHRAAMIGYFGDAAAENEDVIQWMTYECMKTHTHSYVSVFTEAYVTDFRPLLPMIGIPTQTHYASFGALKPEMVKYISEHSTRADAVFYDDCGHLIPWAQPRKFNEELLRFCRKAGL